MDQDGSEIMIRDAETLLLAASLLVISRDSRGTSSRSSGIGCLAFTVALFAQVAYSAILVEQGRPMAVLVTGADASETERFAAGELQRYIRLATGVELPIATDPRAAKATVSVRRQRPGDDERLGEEQFCLRVTNSHVELLGGDDRGTLYAVYEFLRECVGVRWVAPGLEGEYVPQRDTLRVKPVDITRKPAFAYRGFASFPHPDGAEDGPDVAEWLVRSGVNVVDRRWPENLDDDPFLQRHGGAVARWNTHSWLMRIPIEAHAGAHPEFYALIDGKRAPRQGWAKLCTTNAEVVRLMATVAERDLELRPRDTIYALTESDGLGWCTCSRCTALDDERTWSYSKTRSVPVISNRMVTLANDVARRVQTRPDVRFYILAYHADFLPPREPLQPEARVMVQAVHSRPNFNCFSHPVTHDCPRNRAFRKALERWIEISPSVTLYDYILHSQMHQMPWFAPRKIIADIRYYHRIGLDGFAWQCRPQMSMSRGLDCYAAMRAMWDPAVSAEAVIDDYCRIMFAEAAAEAGAYIRSLEDALGRGPCINLGHNMLLVEESDSYRADDHTIDEYLTPSVMQEAAQLLGRARAAARTERTHRYVAQLEHGLEYAKRFTATRHAYLESVRSGTEEAKQHAARTAVAMQAWLYSPHEGDTDLLPTAVARRFLGPILTRVQSGFWDRWRKVAQAAGSAIVTNPGAEDVCLSVLFPSEYRHARAAMTEQVPVGWGCYIGGGSCRWGSTTDNPHSGERCAFVELTEFHREGPSKGAINVSLIPALTDGYVGRHALRLKAGTTYEFAFWLRGDVPRLNVVAQTWTSATAEKATRGTLDCSLKTIEPTSAWREYRGRFTTKADTQRFALKIHAGGSVNSGAKLGSFYLDDVELKAVD